MILADYILIGGAALFAILGFVRGFGKTLGTLTKGLKGVLISIVVCYLVCSMVLNLGFVQSLLEKFRNMLAGSDSTVVQYLTKIRIELIVPGLVLFFVAQIVRQLLVKMLQGISEADNVFMKGINAIFGVAPSVAIFLALLLIAGQIAYWVQGDSGEVYAHLQGSFFHLDEV